MSEIQQSPEEYLTEERGHGYQLIAPIALVNCQVGVLPVEELNATHYAKKLVCWEALPWVVSELKRKSGAISYWKHQHHTQNVMFEYVNSAGRQSRNR